MKKLELVDYKGFRLHKLVSKEYKHVNYLFFWIIYGILFQGVERLWIRDSYYPVYCILDDYIPFCELFVLPYFFWFIYLIGFLVFTFFYDTESFTRSMRFITVTYLLAIAVYIIFPNCQQLRPVAFTRDNILTKIMAVMYQFDTNTNVCPSIHVIGSFAVMLPAWNSKHFATKAWRAAYLISAVLISVSTVFLKQHSVLDILAAIPVCVLGYIVSYYDILSLKFRMKMPEKQETIQG